jgi:hypothetical protein
LKEKASIRQEFEAKLNKTEVELKQNKEQLIQFQDAYNTIKDTLRLESIKYSNLESENKKLQLDIEQAEINCNKLKAQLTELERNNKLLRENHDQMELEFSKQMSMKCNEINELKDSMDDISLCLENRNIEYEKIQNDLQFHLNQIEKLEMQLEKANEEKYTIKQEYDVQIRHMQIDKLNLQNEIERCNSIIKMNEEILIKATAEQNQVKDQAARVINVFYFSFF